MQNRFNPIVSGPGTVLLGHFPSLLWGLFLLLACPWYTAMAVPFPDGPLEGSKAHTAYRAAAAQRGLPPESRKEELDFQAAPKFKETLPKRGTGLWSHVLGLESPSTQVPSWGCGECCPASLDFEGLNRVASWGGRPDNPKNASRHQLFLLWI